MALRHIFAKIKSKLNKILKPKKRITEQEILDKIETAINFLEAEKEKILRKREIEIIEKARTDEQIRLIKEQLPKEAEKEEEEIFNRKIVKVLVYCPNEPHRAGFGHKLYALTWDNSDDDLFDELVAEIENNVSDEVDQGTFQLDFNFTEKTGNKANLLNFRDCHPATDFGYDDELETTDPPFIFPEIEVGEEL